MSPVVVGISDCRVSADPGATIITYALGSCIAVLLYDPNRKAGGMLHYMLPESSLDPGKASANPCMFADTGITVLLDRLRAHGVEPRKALVHLVGGAQMMDRQNVFDIGRRNYLAARKALWKHGLFVAAEAVGGEISRTVRLEIGSGRSWLREGGKSECELPQTRLGAAAVSVAVLNASVPAIRRLQPTAIGIARNAERATGGNLWRSEF